MTDGDAGDRFRVGMDVDGPVTGVPGRPFVLAVAGTTDERSALLALPHLRRRLDGLGRPFVVATCGAVGIDLLAEREALAAGALCAVRIIPNGLIPGESIYTICSGLMLRLLWPDLLLAYPTGERGESSHVTWWTVDAARELGLPTDVRPLWVPRRQGRGDTGRGMTWGG